LRWPFPSVEANWYGVWHARASERVLQYGGPFVAFVLAILPYVLVRGPVSRLARGSSRKRAIAAKSN
jgi:hypothetical protein